MSVRKDAKRGTWLVKLHYTNRDGEAIDSTKRGFKTKAEALAWERDFLANEARSTSMTFKQFVKVYAEDVRPRLRETTWRSKEYMINEKLIPFFGEMRVVDITSKEVMDWQNGLLRAKDENGKKFSETYIRTVENQLSAILNHAVRHYGLPSNPLQKAGRVGEKQGKEMKFWTTEEYSRFAEAVSDKPESYYAFEALYWCRLCVGEMLALTPEHIGFETSTIKVRRSYQRYKSRDVITDPKTPKSVRDVKMPAFLRDEREDYVGGLGIEPDDRVFPVTKYFMRQLNAAQERLTPTFAMRSKLEPSVLLLPLALYAKPSALRATRFAAGAGLRTRRSPKWTQSIKDKAMIAIQHYMEHRDCEILAID